MLIILRKERKVYLAFNIQHGNPTTFIINGMINQLQNEDPSGTDSEDETSLIRRGTSVTCYIDE